MKNADEPAFATLIYHPVSGQPCGHRVGLTKREYFAAMAMQGFLSGTYSDVHRNGWPDLVEVAKVSVLAADELLKQLES